MRVLLFAVPFLLLGVFRVEGSPDVLVVVLGGEDGPEGTVLKLVLLLPLLVLLPLSFVPLLLLEVLTGL